MRTLFFALAVYIGALAVVDNVSYHGRYRSAIFNALTQQAYRAQADFKNFLERSGITSVAVARP